MTWLRPVPEPDPIPCSWRLGVEGATKTIRAAPTEEPGYRANPRSQPCQVCQVGIESLLCFHQRSHVPMWSHTLDILFYRIFVAICD